MYKEGMMMAYWQLVTHIKNSLEKFSSEMFDQRVGINVNHLSLADTLSSVSFLIGKDMLESQSVR